MLYAQQIKKLDAYFKEKKQVIHAIFLLGE
jgi:hypothetical protein